jgi:hypothetical protein
MYVFMYSKLNKVEVPFFTFGHQNLIQKEHCLAVLLLGSMGSEKQIGPHIYLLCTDKKIQRSNQTEVCDNFPDHLCDRVQCLQL